MIVKMNSFKPRSVSRIYKELKKVCKDQFPDPVLKTLASIAHEFDCMVRDTANELVRVKKENALLKKELGR